MLPYQTPGILNQAVVFMRDVKMFALRTDILVKNAIFDNTPAEKRYGPKILVPQNFMKNLISTIWDSFSWWYKPFISPFLSVTDGQNANT